MGSVIGLGLGAIALLLLLVGCQAESEEEDSSAESPPKPNTPDSSSKPSTPSSSSSVPILPPSSVSSDPKGEIDDNLSDAPILIAVDSGHGNLGDPGAVSGDLKESDITLGTVKYLEEYFSKDKNYKTINTKENGSEGVNQRVATANAAGAELLISVHINSATATSTGFSCYPLPPGRTNHDDSLRFAKLIIGFVGSLGYSIYNPNTTAPGVAYCFYSDANTKKFANQDNVTTVEYRNDPTFGIVEHSNCPAVLSEQGFISNPNDVKIFCTDEGQRILAACYYNAVCEYFSTKPTVDSKGNPVS